MNHLTLEVHNREKLGKNANRQLRAQGQIPAVVYGEGKDPVAIRVERKRVEDLLKNAGENPVFLLSLGSTGQTRHAMIREMQKDALTGAMVHIDFQRIRLDQKIHVTVPIELSGVAYGVKTQSGLLDFVTREIEIECLPDRIPPHLELDVTPLHLGQHIEAQDLVLPDGITLRSDPHRVVVSVAHARLATASEEGGDGTLEGAKAEPELIRRSKEET